MTFPSVSLYNVYNYCVHCVHFSSLYVPLLACLRGVTFTSFGFVLQIASLASQDYALA